MELLFKIKDKILEDALTMSQRGLLITILLLRNQDPKITLAILKAKVKLNHNDKEDLMLLHEGGYIKWSEYDKYKKSLEKIILGPDVIEAVSFMNSLYGRKFDINSASTTKNLIARIKQYGLEKVKLVISNRYEEWKDDTKMKKYLKPSTIFRSSKFDKYLEEVLTTGKGSKFVKADSIGLNDGDSIWKDVVKTFSDTEVYEVKCYSLDPVNSGRVGIGIKQKHYGKDLKVLIKVQERKVSRGKPREFEYTYIKQ